MSVLLIVVVAIVGGLSLLVVGALVAARLATPSAAVMELGLTEGRLAACPEAFNCVSTMAEDKAHRVDAVAYNVSRDEAFAAVTAAISDLPRVRIVAQDEFYLHAEVRSLLFRFIDDVEIYLPYDEAVIHFRSASRAGQGDLGVNRKRYETFREAVGAKLQGAAE